jgi:hypothetical protein
MKFTKFIVLCLILVVCSASAKKNEKLSRAKDSTNECIFMKEVCDEAADFQKEYDAMPEGDEKKEMVSVLNGYIIHCEKARKDCSKSMK